jgi:L-serine/L-threonine ammonia-lyase
MATPLIRSAPLSAVLDADVYLKLENTHASHSFKHRGIAAFVADAARLHGPSTHCIVASGGNLKI